MLFDVTKIENVHVAIKIWPSSHDEITDRETARVNAATAG